MDKTAPDLASRDEAFAKLATDAAGAKNFQVAMQAVGGIYDLGLKDKTAETCALALSRQGDSKGAANIAQTIYSMEIRDRTMKAIAQNQ